MTLHDLTLALLRTTLATAAAACLAALLLAILRVQSPRTHRIAWSLVILQGWLLIPWTLQIETPAVVPQPAPTGAMPSSASAWSDLATEATWPQPLTTEAMPRVETTKPTPITASSATILTWLAGAAILALVAAWRYIHIIRTLPLGEAPNDPQWQSEFNDAGCHALVRVGMPRTPFPRRSLPQVDLRITTSLGPLLAYIPWQYFILAPRTLWTALTSPERTAILRHELAHLHRGDLWKSLAIRALALPQWFNPLVWLAVRRFDEAAEWSCDAAAAASPSAASGLARESNENAPLTLANALLRTAELCPANSPLTTLGFRAAIPANRRRQSNLTRRIQRLVTPRFKEESTMKLLAIPLLLAAIAGAQLIRIEYVAAEENATPRTTGYPSQIMDIRELKASERRLAASSVFTSDLTAEPTPAPAPVEEEVTLLGKPGSPTVSASEFTERRRREFEARAKLPYIIEPPDILSIKFLATGSHSGVRRDGEAAEPSSFEFQAIVAMDGRITFGAHGELGEVFVAGMTPDEARAAVKKHLLTAPHRIENIDDVAVDVHSYNSKICYVITEHDDGRDDVVRAAVPFPLNAENNVGRYLKSTFGTLSHLKGAKIELRRPAPNGSGAEQVLPVAWDDANERPAPETNHPLLPGDRLFVRAPLVMRPAQIIKSEDILNVTFHSTQGGQFTFGNGDVSDETRTAKSLTFQCPVDAEGKIELRVLWTKEVVAVAGMTSEQAAGAIRAHVLGPEKDKFTVDVDFHYEAQRPGPPRPSALPPRATEVQLKWTDEAGREQETTTGVYVASGMKVGDVVRKAASFTKTPLHLHEGTITITRDGGFSLQPTGPTETIRWDNVEQQPSEDAIVRTDDLVVIDLRPIKAASKPLEVRAARQQKLEFRIELIEDRTGDLGDFDALQRGPITIGDANTTRAALRVFKKHEMITTLAEPTIRTEAGRPAHFALGNPAQGARDGDPLVADQASVELLAHVQADETRGRSLSIELDVREGDQNIDFTFPINEGQTAIVRLTSPNENQSDNKNRAYIVITPTWLD